MITNHYNLRIFFKNKTLNKKNSLIKTFINIKFVDQILIQKKKIRKRFFQTIKLSIKKNWTANLHSKKIKIY